MTVIPKNVLNRISEMIHEVNIHSLRRSYVNTEYIKLYGNELSFGVLNNGNNECYTFKCDISADICMEVMRDSLGKENNSHLLCGGARGMGLDKDNMKIIIQGYDTKNKFHTLEYEYRK